jgi:hypothetical protein
MDTGLELSADTLHALSKRFGKKIKQWLSTEKHAQMNRDRDPRLMDIYDTVTKKSTEGMKTGDVLIFPILMNILSTVSCKSPAAADFTGECRYVHTWSDILDCMWYEDSGTPVSEHIYAHIIVCANCPANILSRLSLRYQLRSQGLKFTTEEAQIIGNKQNRLQKLIDMFQHQADSFILHQQHSDDFPLLLMGDYDEYDHVDDVDSSIDTYEEHAGPSSDNLTLRASDGSGMDNLNPEDLPILLPSSLGWEWCVSHGVQSLATKEVQLRQAQANDAIHQIRLALGFKSALFRTQV